MDAVEGNDYDLEEMLPFWALTNEQDWDICKWQQQGVDLIGYDPGPLSTRKEYNVDAFIRWYLQEMRGDGVAPRSWASPSGRNLGRLACLFTKLLGRGLAPAEALHSAV